MCWEGKLGPSVEGLDDKGLKSKSLGLLPKVNRGLLNNFFFEEVEKEQGCLL